MTVAYPTRDEIRSLCTEQSFERGMNYWQQGRIGGLAVDGEGPFTCRFGVFDPGVGFLGEVDL